MFDLIPLVAIVGFFSAIITFIYFHYKTKHRERMALIEAGMDASVFSKKRKHKKKRSSGTLKYGLMLTGLGAGFLAGVLLDGLFDADGMLIAPFLMVGGGLGLIFSYTVDRRLEQEDDYYANTPPPSRRSRRFEEQDFLDFEGEELREERGI